MRKAIVTAWWSALRRETNNRHGAVPPGMDMKRVTYDAGALTLSHLSAVLGLSIR